MAVTRRRGAVNRADAIARAGRARRLLAGETTYGLCCSAAVGMRPEPSSRPESPTDTVAARQGVAGHRCVPDNLDALTLSACGHDKGDRGSRHEAHARRAHSVGRRPSPRAGHGARTAHGSLRIVARRHRRCVGMTTRAFAAAWGRRAGAGKGRTDRIHASSRFAVDAAEISDVVSDKRFPTLRVARDHRMQLSTLNANGTTP